jgi:sporulation-control protein spo0M
MKEQEITREWNILIAIFRATHEQTNMLTGQTKREAKLIFKRWINEGERLVKLIERESSEDDLDEVTEVIENSVHKLRTKVLEL